MQNTLFVKADDIAEILNISQSKAYSIIKKLNKELDEKGYRTINGRVSTKYFMEQFYGMDELKEVE